MEFVDGWMDVVLDNGTRVQYRVAEKGPPVPYCRGRLFESPEEL